MADVNNVDNLKDVEIKKINQLLKINNLNIPEYQRPYKWDIKNINRLLIDIERAVDESAQYGSEFTYRLGTIILHRNEEKETVDIVDGQQRIISLLLLKQYLEPDFLCSVLNKRFANKITQANIHNNYMRIREWFLLTGPDKKQKFMNAFENMLEVVVIYVHKITEAFQLFDSQNTRGKSLDPHDLLKAYHLREMKKYPDEIMQNAVTKWEATDPKKIRELFDFYLFPIWNWSRGLKSKSFTVKEIDTYKGIRENLPYSYVKRVSRAIPYFQITEPFLAGNDFFEMVDYYLKLLEVIKSEICNQSCFAKIKKELCGDKDVKTPQEMDEIKYNSVGFEYTKNLFYCALLYYYDKFHNFDERVIKKLFTWAFMLRVDMENLGFDSVNKYAIGDDNSRYTNRIGVFFAISIARLHNEISGIPIKVLRPADAPANSRWTGLYHTIKEINGYGE